MKSATWEEALRAAGAVREKRDDDESPTAEAEQPLTHGDLIEVIVGEDRAARETDVTSDGYIYDTQTGEIVGRADVPEKYEVRSIDDAEFVLRLRSEIEGEVSMWDIRTKALLEQLRAGRAQAIRKLSWWDWKFGLSLVHYARSILSRKSKTARFAWGSVSFRKTNGTHQILDMDAAVVWMKTFDPSKVKVKESVTVTDILAVRAALAKELGEEPEHLGWLGSTEPGENVKISTGIDINAKD